MSYTEEIANFLVDSARLNSLVPCGNRHKAIDSRLGRLVLYNYRTEHYIYGTEH